MQRNLIKFLLVTGIVLSCLNIQAQGDKRLVFLEPATHFTESLPLGNGRLGAMVFGDPDNERIILNEISMWSGSVQDADKEDAHQHLPAIRNLLLQGKNKEAQELLQQHFICKGKGSGFGSGARVPFGCYQTLGDVHLNWIGAKSPVSGYSRTLDLDSATATSTWVRDGVQYTQRVFVSAPAQAIIVKLTANKKGSISFSASLYRKEAVGYMKNAKGLLMEGALDNGYGKQGLKWAAMMQVKLSGGSMIHDGQTVKIANADSCILTITAATDMNWPAVNRRGKQPLAVISAQQERLAKLNYLTLLKDHIKDYQYFFNRCTLQLGEGQAVGSDLRSRLNEFSNGATDPALISLYFNFGRYLLISSSRQGGLPANLQGLWAEEYQTPWNGDYHLNINLQMNYWPAEITNLAECQQPLFQYIRQLSVTGRRTAAAYYHARGWVAHVISNPWGFTSPGEGADWGSTLTGGAWLATHIIQSYEYNPDKKFLSQMYPRLKGAALFYTDILIREKQHGHLVTAPSNSPENAFRMADGTIANTCMGPAMDMQIGRQLLLGTAFAANELKVDKELADTLRYLAKELAPTRVSPRTGGIMEWLDDYEEVEPQHRHVSQLYGLYPYHEITPWGTPALASAAKQTLVRRGDGGTGWSRAWKIAFHARLGDGDHARVMLKALLSPVSIKANSAGTYPNLFDAHPPFQIDGNFGATAAIAEFFLQSHGDTSIIRLLPALPYDKNFQQGSVTGLRARNGFEVDFSWQHFELTRLTVKSEYGKKCRIASSKRPDSVISDGKSVPFEYINGVISFLTRSGKKYNVIPAK